MENDVLKQYAVFYKYDKNAPKPQIDYVMFMAKDKQSAIEKFLEKYPNDEVIDVEYRGLEWQPD